MEVGYGGRGGHGHGDRELVESLTKGRNREGRGLALVEDGREVLTSKGIGPRWPGRGDRRGGSVLGEEQKRVKLEQGKDEWRSWAARRAQDDDGERPVVPFIGGAGELDRAY